MLEYTVYIYIACDVTINAKVFLLLFLLLPHRVSHLKRKVKQLWQANLATISISSLLNGTTLNLQEPLCHPQQPSCSGLFGSWVETLSFHPGWQKVNLVHITDLYIICVSKAILFYRQPVNYSFGIRMRSFPDGLWALLGINSFVKSQAWKKQN